MNVCDGQDPSKTEQESLATFGRLIELSAPHRAFVDTAFIYAHPSGAHNEALVGKAIAAHGRDKFTIATKFGIGFAEGKVGRARL